MTQLSLSAVVLSFIYRLKAQCTLLGIGILLSIMAETSLAIGRDLGPQKNLFKIDEIQVYGIKKVEKEAILEKIDSKAGLVLDNYTLKRDIEKIYRLKYFELVEARQINQKNKNILAFYLKEKPIVANIELEGNDELDDDEIIEVLKTKEYTILDINTIKNDVKALQKFYEEKGFYLASIDYEKKIVDAENVDIVFKIKEFDKVKVKKVTFLGNRSFSDSELKSIMETREESLFSWMTGSGSFKEFNFQTDIERIKYFYKTKGHLQIYVNTPEITVSEDKKWVFITISLNEGPQFAINEISFDGELLFPEEELLEKISLKSGETYNQEFLRKDIELMTEMYQDKGHAFANVLRTLDLVPGENRVNVRFSFEKGKIAYFGKITVKGNTKTRDKVIRRELKIREGMRFKGSALRESKENVNRLGFFEPNSVVFKTVSPKGKDDVLDVEITVKERNTGQITLGAGYSTSTKGFVQASIKQNNFRGLGQVLSFSLNLSDSTQTYNLGFTEPYLFDSKWTAGGDIFRTRNTRSTSFHLDRIGFDARVGYPIFEYTRLFFTYKFEDTKLTNINDERIDANQENGIASSVDISLINDRRNNRFEPSKGHYLRVSSEYAGLGGEKFWLKGLIDARYYRRLVGELVFRTRLKTERIIQTKREKPVPRSEKFFLGGARNMRGFNFEAIGPKSTFVDSDGNVSEFNERGLFSILGQVEFEHPLVREAGLKWVVFTDFGNIFKENIGEDGSYAFKVDYGFGFRWFSPIGVLRFEFGYPVNAEDGQDNSQFHFDIGQLF